MPRPLRILQVAALPFPTAQGSQVHVWGRVAGLAARGHSVTLCCYAGGQGPIPEGVEIRRARGVPGDRTERSGPHLSRLPQDLLLIGPVRRALAQGVDLIHAHHVEAPVIARLASVGRRVPLIYEAHTLLAEELPTYLPKVRGLGRIGGWLDRGVPRLCEGAIGLTERATRHLQERARWVATIPPGVEIEGLRGGDGARARARWGLGEGPVVIYTGNTDAYQDLPVCLRAMRQVEATLLVITGDPEAKVRRMARRAGLPSQRLRVVRSRDFADTLDGMAAAQVGVLPRTRCAGFPIKLLNLLGCGVPTVAAQGSSQAISGVITVPDGDEGAMAREIRALLADPYRRRALGQQARQAIATGWTRQVAAERLERFYRRVLGEDQSQPATSASAASM